MIKIAVADDEHQYIERIENVLREYSEKHSLEFLIETYSSSLFLNEDIKGGKGFDIFFMDVEMPDYSGFDVAKTIREKYFESFIIFITNHSEYATEGYEVSALRYILKDHIEERVPIVLDIIIPQLEDMKAKFYSFEQPEGRLYVRPSDIIMIRKEGEKNLTIVTRKGNLSVRSSLKSILKELSSDEFILVNKKNIVNLGHVNGINERIMLLSDGSEVTVSRDWIQNVKMAVSEYYRKK